MLFRSKTRSGGQERSAKSRSKRSEGQGEQKNVTTTMKSSDIDPMENSESYKKLPFFQSHDQNEESVRSKIKDTELFEKKTRSSKVNNGNNIMPSKKKVLPTQNLSRRLTHQGLQTQSRSSTAKNNEVENGPRKKWPLMTRASLEP